MSDSTILFRRSRALADMSKIVRALGYGRKSNYSAQVACLPSRKIRAERYWDEADFTARARVVPLKNLIRVTKVKRRNGKAIVWSTMTGCGLAAAGHQLRSDSSAFISD